MGTSRGILFLIALLASARAIAAPADGFVLTQWGSWTVAETLPALDEAHRLGARNITILVNLCEDSKSSSDMHWCDAAPGEPMITSFQGGRLMQLLPEIRARGMEFNFIPMVRAEGLDNRQWIWPSDRGAWFKNYGSRMEELALFAQQQGASSLIVGSELTLLFLENDGWRDVIRRVRRIYSGHLTISPVFAQYPLIRFWDALDSIGISAYFPLTLSDSLSAQFILTNAWRAHRNALLTFAAIYGKPLTFVEVGYPTTNIAASRPWDYDWGNRTLDAELPKRCWEAFRKVWAGEPRLRTFQIWGISGQPEPEKAFSPVHKASEPVVQRIFRERTAL
jgi:hypothetical protein